MSRIDQGFPPKIEDDRVLDAAAALLADVLAEWVRPRRDDAPAELDRGDRDGTS
jgi:hypothetical protein